MSLAQEGVFYVFLCLYVPFVSSKTKGTEVAQLLLQYSVQGKTTKQVIVFVVPFFTIKAHFVILLIFHCPVQKHSQHYYIYSYQTSSMNFEKLRNTRQLTTKPNRIILKNIYNSVSLWWLWVILLKQADIDKVTGSNC